MTNPITEKELFDKVTSNRTGINRRAIIRDALFAELRHRSCFGGKKHTNYTEFRKAVIDTAINHSVLPSGYQVAALNFNNLRKEINDVVAAYGGLVIDGTTYAPEDAVIERDPAVKKPNGPRIPEGKWFIVNKKTNSVAEGLSNRAFATKLCNKSTQTVMSREDYITEVL